MLHPYAAWVPHPVPSQVWPPLPVLQPTSRLPPGSQCLLLTTGSCHTITNFTNPETAYTYPGLTLWICLILSSPNPPQTQIYLYTQGLSQDAHSTHQPSPLCPPDFMPSKPHLTSRPNPTCTASTYSVHIRHRANKNNPHVQISLQKYK